MHLLQRRLPCNASAPAVVIILSPVLMLSFMSIGMPCSGPRSLPALRSASIASAIDNASGLSSMMAFSFGPSLSIAAIRFKYISVIPREVCLPDCINCCNASISLFHSTQNHQ